MAVKLELSSAQFHRLGRTSKSKTYRNVGLYLFYRGYAGVTSKSASPKNIGYLMRKIALVCFLFFASITNATPLLYKFEGTINLLIDRAGIAADSNLSVGSHVEYTFLVDFDAAASYLYNDGRTLIWGDNFWINSSGNPAGIDTFYAKYLWGTALTEKDGGSHNNPFYVAEFNYGQDYYNYNDSGINRGGLSGQSDNALLQVGSDKFLVSDWIVGTQLTGFNLAYDSIGRYSAYYADITLMSLSENAVPEPKTYELIMAGLGIMCVMSRRRKVMQA